MKWYNVELKKTDADGLKALLHSLKVKFETSGAGAMVHFEILLNEGGAEFEKINDYLESN